MRGNQSLQEKATSLLRANKEDALTQLKKEVFDRDNYLEIERMIACDWGRNNFTKRNKYVDTRRVTTDKGVQVDMNLYENVNDVPSEPWVVDLIEPSIDGVKAGYLKISYIPEEKWEAYVPDAFHYMNRVNNRYGELDHILEKEEWDKEDYVQLLQKTDGYSRDSDRSQKSKEELKIEWDQRLLIINKTYAEEYQQFKDFHLDKPFVDYIRVYKEGDAVLQTPSDPGTEGLEGHLRRHTDEKATTSFQRQGISISMYQAASEWLKEKGLHLYASNLQQPEAAQAWQKMEEKGLVKQSIYKTRKGEQRRYLA